MKETNKKFLGFIFWQEGCSIDSNSFLRDINEILSNHKGGFVMHNVFTDKTFHYYEGIVLSNSEAHSTISEDAQQYFEEQLMARDVALENL